MTDRLLGRNCDVINKLTRYHAARRTEVTWQRLSLDFVEAGEAFW
jgi:hypothetical protein